MQGIKLRWFFFFWYWMHYCITSDCFVCLTFISDIPGIVAPNLAQLSRTPVRQSGKISVDRIMWLIYWARCIQQTMTSAALTLQFSALQHPLIPTSYSFTSKSRKYNEPTATMPEYEQELPESIMPRILQIEDLISTQRATMMEEMTVGWLYRGDELLEELEGIVGSLREEGGFDVSFPCSP